MILVGVKNYIMLVGYKWLRDELLNLIDVECFEVVWFVLWVVLNGDWLENGDYIYGKWWFCEIDCCICFLMKWFDFVEVVDVS